jgi:hypothetical protein
VTTGERVAETVTVPVTLLAPKVVFPRFDFPEAPGNCPF